MAEISVLMAGCLDFIEQMRKHTSGWEYEPLVKLTNYHIEKKLSHLLVIKQTPRGISPTQFYVDNCSADSNTFIKIKIPLLRESRLVMIRLDNPGHLDSRVKLNCFVAQGRQCHIKGANAFELMRICRVTRSTSRKKPLTINTDYWDLASAKIDTYTIRNIRDVLLASCKIKLSCIDRYWPLVIDSVTWRQVRVNHYFPGNHIN